MKTQRLIPILLVGIMLVFLTGQSCRAEREPRIINGRPASTTTYPWMASLGIGSAFNPSPPYGACGGSLIAPTWVLTAAHCFLNENQTAVDPDASQYTRVLFNSDNIVDLSPSAIERSASRVIIHPSYLNTSIREDFDIALVELANPVTELTPVPLAKVGNPPAVDTQGLVLGWGLTENDTYSDNLLQVEQSVISNADCLSIYQYGISDRMLCAGGLTATDTSDTCQGDSGGPLVIFDGSTALQAGVTSFGGITKECGEAGVPGVYTRIDAMNDFIGQYATDANFVAPGAGTPSRPRLRNISVRCNIQEAANMAIAGFVISGEGDKQILLRALSVPQLSPDFDPQLELMQWVQGQWLSQGVNEDWQNAGNAADVGNLSDNLVPDSPNDAALLLTLKPGVYTLLVKPQSGSGIGVAGVDDLDNLDTMQAYLSNISGRCLVDADRDNAIAGYIIEGDGELPVLLRGLRVTASSPDNPLDPALELVQITPGTHSTTLLETNETAFNHARWPEISQLSSNLVPTDSYDAAILRDLPAGVYTVLLKPSSSFPGLGIVGVDALD